jgi:N4-gp56 family major capsid protein
MAVTNFIPDLWTAKLLVALRKAHVAGALVNRDYEGEIKRQGDTVKITSINDVTIGTYTAHNDITVEDIDDATRSLVIDQARYFAVELDDIEKAQHVKGGGSPLAQAVNNAAYQLADISDAFLLDAINDAAEGTGNDLGTVAIHGTNEDALYDSIVDLGVALDEANVPEMGRFVVVSPDLHGRLRKLDRFVATGDEVAAQTRTRGFIGEVAGLPVYKSNNLPAVTDATATGGLAIAGYSGATTFAEQIVSVEAARMEKRFADMVKGLHVYGAKVVRPTALAVVEFDATA